MTHSPLRLSSVYRFFPARRTSSSRRRRMGYALASWRMSFAQSWKGLRWTPGLALEIRWRCFFGRASSDITKWAAPPISMPSAESAWMFGNNVGMKRCTAKHGDGRSQAALPALESESVIWGGGFTKRSNATVAGRSRTVIRSSSSDLGREAKDRGDLSAIVCCARTATTFMSRSSVLAPWFCRLAANKEAGGLNGLNGSSSGSSSLSRRENQ